MKYSTILMMEEKITKEKISDLFKCMDILEMAGHIHPEESKIYTQEYERLRKELIFTHSIEEADMEMSKRTIKQGKYYLN